MVLEDSESDAAAAMEFYVGDSRWQYDSDGESEEAVLREKLDIKLDKPIYKPGEKATVYVNGSFNGSMLMTVETDKLLHYEMTSVSDGKGEFTIDVTEDMYPNAWITAHLVKPAVEEDIWGAHRSFEAVPIQLDYSPTILSVDILPPEKINPASTNKISIQLRDSNGSGIRGEVLVMLVDDGVLSLTRYEAPDFYEYYTRRRGLVLSVHDVYDQLMPLYLRNSPVLSPGGGMNEDALAMMTKASLSPVKSKRFKVLTITDRVFTDENGRVDISLDVPEFSGRARLMVVAAAQRAFGAAERTFEIARDVVVELSLPRVLAPEDVFDSEMLLFNRTSASLDMEVELRIDGPLYIIEGSGKILPGNARTYSERISLPPSESAYSLPFLMAAEGVSGTTRLDVLARYPGGESSETIELAVRPPYPRISLTGSVMIPPAASADIPLAANLFPGTRRAMVNMSGLPTIGLSDMASFLHYYPYGCLEQTVSSGRVLLAQPDIAALIDPNLLTQEHIASEIRQRIRRIQSLQTYSGNFSMWPYSNYDNWASVYAVHFLVSCQKKGVDVPEGTLKAALDYLDRQIALAPEDAGGRTYGAGLALRAYISYVKSLRGEAPLGWMSYLRDNIGNMPEYGKIMLATAYARCGQRDLARGMLGEAVPPIVRHDAGNDVDLNFDSDLRTQAMYLMAWNEIDPTDPNAAASAAALLQSLKGWSYLTTQDAGWAFSSLSDFFAFNKVDGNPTLELFRDNSERVAVVSGDENASWRADEEVNSLSITNTGDGNGYASWVIDGVPLSAPDPVDSGISAVVRYYDSEGRPIPDNLEIKRGQRVVGELKIQSLGGNVRNIVAVLPFAGGLEIENERLMDSNRSAEDENRQEGAYSSARAELRDDRLIIFVDYFTRTFTWKFTMRAVTSGKFAMPPIAVEGMYSPGTRSIGSTSRMTIR
jgi:uncharacterized protein YfaS (alpha-2-macroglobulin family)